MRRLIGLLFTIAAISPTLLPAPAAAQSSTPAAAQSSPPPGALVRAEPNRPVEVELRSAATSVAPGDTIPIALRLRPEQGWHMYWRHSGDVGSPAVLSWRVPQGFATL